jgi:hypothetical protein
MTCQCMRCLDESGATTKMFGREIPVSHVRMVVCQTCGNKRCPHATDHDFACTDSNEPGQKGSVYA